MISPLEEYDDNEFEDEFTSHNAHLSIEGTIPTHESNDEIEQNEGAKYMQFNTCQYRQ